MADKAIPKLSGSGVTIGGNKTLEEYLDEEEAKETACEYIQIGKQPKYFKPRDKFKIMKGKSGITRIYTRREINKEHWREQLMNLKDSSLSKAARIDRAILTVFLNGKEIIGRDLKVLVKQALPDVTRKDYDIRASHLTRKTDLSKLIEIRRIGNNNCFKLVTPALDLRVEELHMFAYKDMKKREEVLKRHKGLRPYFEEEKKPHIQLEVKPDAEPQTEPDKTDPAPDMAHVGKEPLWSEEIHGTLEQAMSKALGIDVSISGRIEFVFKLGE